MKKTWMNNWIWISGLFLAAFIVAQPLQVSAEEATVTFGSESYEKGQDEEFPIGVYIRGETGIGTYYVEVEYDTERMEYLDGGDEVKDGLVILQGTGLLDEVRYMLNFRAVSGGEAGICIRYASVKPQNAGGDFTVTKLGEAPITIEGIDVTGISFFDVLAEENADENSPDTGDDGEAVSIAEVYELDTEVPLLAAVTFNDGHILYLVDHAQYIPEAVWWRSNRAEGSYGNQKVTFLTDMGGNTRILYLTDGEGNFEPYAYNREDGLLYPCIKTVNDGMTYLYMSVHACAEWPEELNMQVVAEDAVFFAINGEGRGTFYQLNEEGHLTEWKAEDSRAASSTQVRKLLYIFLVAFLVILVIGFAAYAVERRQRMERYRRYRQLERERRKLQETEPEIEDIGDEDWDEEAVPLSEDEEVGDPPIISVRNVTMVFHISTSNASGIKEYIIQCIKHQVKSRELVALDHVSFDVFKGEVVGIIGTNGSGKSTLLRIVAGALNPTGGQVLVDRRKVQLLTLGTGFDMELSARENVYLNGSIIGYSKEFLDAHYEEIVEFAELQDFMEEKVKNFSSGMVSRLGFAIATAGDAAEILILDEVLSVGDEFFKKKSLKRIKEMIHGGSTVLMVSHGMGTILENCTKVVWIEKGVLQMVGEAKEVCGAYQRGERCG